MSFLSYSQYMKSLESVFFLRQWLTILALFVSGLFPTLIIRKRLPELRELLFSFPLGLSIYGVSGFLLLISGLGISVPGIICTYLVIMLGLMLFLHFHPVNPPASGVFDDNKRQRAVVFIVSFITVALIAALASSGFLSQNVSNDSVYYYSMYPSILVKNRVITASLDKFLTDVGQTTAVVQCLPFLFGFDESFGIQHFLNLNFILIFYTALFDILCKPLPKKRLRISAAFLGTLFLISCEPYIVISKWVLSNIYFTDFLFMVFFLAFKTSEDGEDADLLRDFSLVFMTAFLVMSRMEGGVLVFVMAMAFSATAMKKKSLLLYFGLPLAIMELGYYGMIYLKVGIDPLYSFLDMRSALLMAGMIVFLIVYIIFFRKLIALSYVPILLLGALLLGNAGLLVINHERYITNIKAFLLNIRQGNGWGFFSIIIVIYCLMLVFELVRRRFTDLPVLTFLPAALVLSIFAVCFARGGVLAVRTSDSGNRVLMEIVPLLFFSVYVFCISEAAKDRPEARPLGERGGSL